MFKVSSIHQPFLGQILRLSVTANHLCFRPVLGFRWRTSFRIAQGPTVTADAVLGRDGFLAGFEGSYNVSEGRVTKYAAAVGFSAPEYAVAVHGLGNLSTFAASYYHRVNPDVEAGAKATWDTKASASAVSLEVAAKA